MMEIKRYTRTRSSTLRIIQLIVVFFLCLLPSKKALEQNNGRPQSSSSTTLTGLQSTQPIASEDNNTQFLPVVISESVHDLFGIQIYSNGSLTNKLISSSVTDRVCGLRITCYEDKAVENKPLCSFECSPCHCDDMCHFYGDCCPGKLFEYSPNVPTEKPKFVTCFGKDGDAVRWGDHQHIFMVSKCPESPNLNEFIVTKCEYPDITRFAEATPVSDMATQITYVNEFCARCHGIKHFQIWSQNVSCRIEADLGMVRTREELWRLVMTDKTCAAELQSVPPVGLELRVCYPFWIDKCNVTGRWIKNLNPMAELFCGMYQHTVDHYGTSSTGVSYRNVFCAICNGATLEVPDICARVSPEFPPSVSVLLFFNPPENDVSPVTENRLQCRAGYIYDPFSVACQELKCPARRVLDQGDCRVPFLSTAGLGFAYHQQIRLENSTLVNASKFITEYTANFKRFFNEYGPFLYIGFALEFFESKTNNSYVELVWVTAKFISKSSTQVTDVEHRVVKFLTFSWSYYDLATNTNTTVFSSRIKCPADSYSEIGYESVNRQLHEEHFDIETLDTSMSFATIELNCSFLEYDLSSANFSYDPKTSTVLLDGNQIHLDRSRVLLCNGTLRICSDVLVDILGALEEFLFRSQDADLFDKTLSVISLISIILSLVSLFGTFVVFCLAPKLRTAPGRNIMALVFHLFCAQLVFLSLSNRVEIRILCQVFAVLIHYFWITTFTWMMALAYQMHKVFASFPSMASNSSKNQKLVWKYLLVCDLTALIPVIVCIAYYLITTDGEHVGYGRTICFLNDAWAIGAFFAAPLCIMLLFNAVCFARTFLTVGCRQQIETDSDIPNINYVLIYVKLSALLGFSWAFGILAAILNSLVLWYVFVILTGCHGVFIFLAYCVNKRTWASVKVTLSERSSTRSTDGSGK
ncbi:uncharacterized protein LOC135466312 [Liolophura sinensis]|uniref:uncharacterized protein LOC135466312 n=1 Tax=Liolophura sinensis TaxID=3198878 RepID=UPI0031582CCF